MTDRWFTEPAEACPAEINPEFTDTERASFREILTFARNHANFGQELMHCIDGAGTLVHGTSTGVGSAAITPEIRKAIMAATGGSRLWHNHPSQDSLSHCDWKCAATKEQPEVLALNERGSFYVGRIVEWDDRLPELFKWLPRLGCDLEDHLSALAVERGLDGPDLAVLSEFTGHVLNLALADHTNVRYAYRLALADQATIERCSSFGIIADGRTFAGAAIDWKLGRLAAAPPKPTGP